MIRGCGADLVCFNYLTCLFSSFSKSLLRRVSSASFSPQTYAHLRQATSALPCDTHIPLFHPPTPAQLSHTHLTNTTSKQLINILLTILGYFPGHIHAFYLEYKHYHNKDLANRASNQGAYNEAGYGAPQQDVQYGAPAGQATGVYR